VIWGWNGFDRWDVEKDAEDMMYQIRLTIDSCGLVHGLAWTVRRCYCLEKLIHMDLMRGIDTTAASHTVQLADYGIQYYVISNGSV
jgi:hypothetical protein